MSLQHIAGEDWGRTNRTAGSTITPDGLRRRSRRRTTMPSLARIVLEMATEIGDIRRDIRELHRRQAQHARILDAAVPIAIGSEAGDTVDQCVAGAAADTDTARFRPGPRRGHAARSVAARC